MPKVSSVTVNKADNEGFSVNVSFKDEKDSKGSMHYIPSKTLVFEDVESMQNYIGKVFDAGKKHTAREAVELAKKEVG